MYCLAMNMVDVWTCSERRYMKTSWSQNELLKLSLPKEQQQSIGMEGNSM